MAHKPVTLQLLRDGQCTPWGFRMSGGADIGTPLLIQRVNMGSPSEGELQKGDIILFIGDHDARKMSHQKASEVIAKSGNNLKLVVARSAVPPPMSPTMSPTPGMPPTIYYLKSNTTSQGISPLVSYHGNPDLFKPLPKTEFQNEIGRSASNYETLYNTYNAEEKAAITNQAYRTLPLITPSLKTTKDYPLGSYLRHTADTSGRAKATNVANRVTDAYMLTKVQEAVIEKALSSPRASVSSSRTPTPDSGYQSVYLRQYNSPINIYSTQNVVETLNAQTAAHKQYHHLNSPIVQTPLPTPSVPDLSKSPTYQLIHEQEKVKEHKAVENRVYTIEEPPKSGWEQSYENIQQSGTFKVVMSNVKGINV